MLQLMMMACGLPPHSYCPSLRPVLVEHKLNKCTSVRSSSRRPIYVLQLVWSHWLSKCTMKTTKQTQIMWKNSCLGCCLSFGISFLIGDSLYVYLCATMCIYCGYCVKPMNKISTLFSRRCRSKSIEQRKLLFFTVFFKVNQQIIKRIENVPTINFN